MCLEVIGQEGYDLKIESLQDLTMKPPIEVRSVKKVDGQTRATIYVPEAKLANFVRKIERYATENNARGGRPKHEDLMAGISGIRFPVLRSFWTDSEDLFPESEDECIWWEVWIHISQHEDSDEVFAHFTTTIGDSNLRFSQHVIKFPERLVFQAFGCAQEWARVFVPLLDRIAELRKAKEIPTDYIRLTPQDQGRFVEDLAHRIKAPGVNAPAVCILDFGVHPQHPLIRRAIADSDAQSLDPSWPVVDPNQPHGTEMAGLALFGGDLQRLLSGNDQVELRHRLESVRMLHDQHPHSEDTWGYVTQASLAKAEIQAAQRQRVACLSVTAQDNGRDNGFPSSWSGAIDQHASGQLDDFQRLYVLSAGNIGDICKDPHYQYFDTNLKRNIEDPAQSWNALTVGAFTERVGIQSPDWDGYQALAPPGGLCPSSRTSHGWDDHTWPIKPDITMEGGNYARSPSGKVDGCDDLALLTTTLEPTGGLLTWSSDTSAATAQAARLAAILMADYPNLWPETIRGLLVHSAEWTPEMMRQVRGNLVADCHKRLRCFGYGVPNIDRARYTLENCVSLIHQGNIQPYRLEGSDAKSNHFVFHSLPWPTSALQQLHDQDVTIRITLSYFIEPSPGRRGWGKKFRYASHGLRFALRGPTEGQRHFRQRISTDEWEADHQTRPSTGDPISWALGTGLQTRGSIHSDWWTTSAADLAQCGQVAVFPVTGWWRERKHLGNAQKIARYSLIITLSTPDTEIDLYTPIAQEVGIVAEIGTE